MLTTVPFVSHNLGAAHVNKFVHSNAPAQLEQAKRRLTANASQDGQVLLGRAFVSGQEFENAINLYSSIGPHQNVVHYLHHGEALFEAGRLDEAVVIWRQGNIDARYLVGQSSPTDYVRWHEAALEVDRSSHTYKLIGDYLDKIESPNLSLEAYDAAVLLDTGWESEREAFSAYYHRARLSYFGRGTLPNSVVVIALQEAIELGEQQDSQFVDSLRNWLAVVQ